MLDTDHKSVQEAPLLFHIDGDDVYANNDGANRNLIFVLIRPS